MITPIYASKQHEVILEEYLIMTDSFINDISTKSRYNNYLDVLSIVIEYHNNYGKTRTSSNWYDWIMILPVNVSVMTNGYLAAIETKKNAATVRAYKLILNEKLQEVITRLENLEISNE
jgi:hypothetical protein